MIRRLNDIPLDAIEDKDDIAAIGVQSEAGDRDARFVVARG
ncbi:MAG TPA: hypothetical protein PLY47_11710 [Rhodoglobus sp.]|nr:hypothetical protein [Rhodoglobus sp.]